MQTADASSTPSRTPVALSWARLGSREPKAGNSVRTGPPRPSPLRASARWTARVYGECYVPLRQILDDWSRRSGESSVEILQRLIGIAGQLQVTPSAFKRQANRPLGEIVTQPMLEQLRAALIAEDTAKRTDGEAALSELAIAEEFVLELCRVASVRPPDCLLSGRSSLEWLSARHLTLPSQGLTEREIAVLKALHTRRVEKDPAARMAASVRAAVSVGSTGKHAGSGAALGPADNVQTSGSTRKTGFAGRPPLIARDLLEAELERRVEAGQVWPSKMQAVRDLLEWLKQAHPKVSRPKPRAVENTFRYRIPVDASLRSNRTKLS